MRIFITGGTGYIGSHVVRRLAGSGHELVCLVPGAGSERDAHGARLVGGDVTDHASVARAMRGCDRVIHLASLHSFWERDPRRWADVNVTGTRVVMEVALEERVRRVVHVSTALVYGHPPDDLFTEESEPGPELFSEFARTRRDGDRVVWAMQRELGLPVVVLQPGIVLGPGQPDDAVGALVTALAEHDLPAAPFADVPLTVVHVRDVAEAIVRALDATGVVGQAYLLGTGVARLGDLAGAAAPRVPDALAMATAHVLTGLAALTGRPPRWGLSTDHARTLREGLRFDGSKAERELGFSYTPIADAVRETAVRT